MEPTEFQLKMLDKLRTNIANAEARVAKIAEICQREAAHGTDITAPRIAEFGEGEESMSYGLPSLLSSLEGKQKALAMRKREYDVYVTKLRAKGVTV